jgi:hypothetical protein
MSNSFSPSTTEPSAVATDTKVYFGDIRRQEKRQACESRTDALRTKVDFQHPALPRPVLQ